MSDVFSTPAEHALSHPELDLIRPEAGPSTNGDALSELSLEEAFEVEDTIRIILDGGYKTVRPSFLQASTSSFKAEFLGSEGRKLIF